MRTTRTTHTTRQATLGMDATRPWQAFAAPPASSSHDARGWLRAVLLTPFSAATVLLRLGAAAQAWTDDTSTTPQGARATS
jgi:hypothetical protein